MRICRGRDASSVSLRSCNEPILEWRITIVHNSDDDADDDDDELLLLLYVLMTICCGDEDSSCEK